MTDRFNGLLVTLDRDIRSDDAEALMNAIRQMRGVAAVRGNVADIKSQLAFDKATWDLRKKLWEVLDGTRT